MHKDSRDSTKSQLLNTQKVNVHTLLCSALFTAHSPQHRYHKVRGPGKSVADCFNMISYLRHKLQIHTQAAALSR